MSEKSNREALRKLTRKYPASPEIERLWDELYHQPDMAVAIVSIALIEATLERAIIARFKCQDKNLVGQIFLNRGPLADFHSKILIADAFGIITRGGASDLHSFKTIRNVFAHAKIPIEFGHETVLREIHSLTLYRTISKGTHKLDGVELRPKAWFHLCAKIMHIVLDGMAKDPSLGTPTILEPGASPNPRASEPLP